MMGIAALHPSYSHLQQPIRLGNLQLPNRIMFTTHGPRLSQARYVRYIEERARGGVALMGFNLGPLGIMQFPFGPGRFNAASAADIDSVPAHPLSAEGRAYYDSLVPGYRAWASSIIPAPPSTRTSSSRRWHPPTCRTSTSATIPIRCRRPRSPI